MTMDQMNSPINSSALTILFAGASLALTGCTTKQAPTSETRYWHEQSAVVHQHSDHARSKIAREHNRVTPAPVTPKKPKVEAPSAGLADQPERSKPESKPAPPEKVNLEGDDVKLEGTK